ncbi:hypothetical protein AURDEDRAFT_124761 [Auricularia subglabra TFB-10046 SS5]|nr:hypothetical protein AURDEDRAFT_124761 [Auricularia subglabra TFB-10046 SS5]
MCVAPASKSPSCSPGFTRRSPPANTAVVAAVAGGAAAPAKQSTAPPAIDFDSGNLLGLSLSPPSWDSRPEPGEPWGDRPWGNPTAPPLEPMPFAPRHYLGPPVDWREPVNHPPAPVVVPVASPVAGPSYMHILTPSNHRPHSTAHASASGAGSI